MGTLSLSLSHPRSIELFEGWAQKFLCEQGYWSVESQQQCLQEAKSLGVHRLDAQFIIARAKDSPPVREAFAEAARQLPRQLWFELDPPPSFRAVVVVDNSDSAQAHCNAISVYAQLLEQETESLGALDFWAWDVPVQDCAALARRRFANASLFGPVWKRLKPQLECGAYTHAIVLGSGQLFDLEDYAGEEHLERVFFVPIGNGLTGGVVPERWLDAKHMAVSLLPAVSSVVVGGSHVLPVWWDNPNYQWNGERLELVAQGQMASTRLRSSWLCIGEDVPSAVSSKGGKEFAVSLHPLAQQENGATQGGKATISNGNREVILPLKSGHSKGQQTSFSRHRFENGQWKSAPPSAQAQEGTYAATG